MNRIKSLHVYPIKSLGGIDLESAQATSAGLEYDRQWMLIDERNMFMTQRTLAKMCLFKTSIENGSLTVNFYGDSVSVPLKYEDKPLEDCLIWDDHTTAYEVDPMVSAWFSKKLHRNSRLVRINKECDRNHKEKGNLKMGLADGYPFLFLGTASLKQLNSKLESHVPVSRFRPNIVFETAEAHVEDSWKQVQIGTASFEIKGPCARCSVVTIDQESALVSKEPLRTLSQYRKEGERVHFGTNVYCKAIGKVSVGDEVKFM